MKPFTYIYSFRHMIMIHNKMISIFAKKTAVIVHKIIQ